MKKNKCITCSLFLGLGFTALNANVTATGSKTNFCENESVSVSYSGADLSSPGSSCCDGEGLWVEDGVATYSWSGDASGTSASATLDTSSVGSKTADVVVTQNWKCSEGSETDSTTVNGSGTFTVNDGVAYTGGNPCTPGTISSSGGHLYGSGTQNLGSVTDSKVISLFPYRRAIRQYSNASLRNILHDIIATKDGVVQKSNQCGDGVQSRTRSVGAFSHSFGISLLGFSYSGSWSGSVDTFDIYTSDEGYGADANKWEFGQAYKISWKLTSALLNGSFTETIVDVSNVVKSTYNGTSNDDLVFLGSTTEEVQYSAGDPCEMCCSN